MQNKKPIVTYVIVGICFIFFLLSNVIKMNTNAETGILLGAYYKVFIMAGEWWRLLTCGFIHVNLMHFAVNMISLMNLGRFIEIVFGKKKFLTILLLSIIGGSLFMFILAGNTIAVGLSGGLYGLMAAYTFYLIQKGMWKIPQVRMSLTQIYLVNFWINFMPGIAYEGHLGGFVVGLLVSFILLQDSKKLKMHGIITTCILFVFLAFQIPANNYLRINDPRYTASDISILNKEKEIGLIDYVNQMAVKLDKIYESGTLIQDGIKGE